jgi:hypothetical protein
MKRVTEDIQRYPILRPFSTMLRHTELFRIYGVRLPLVVTEWLSSFHPPVVTPQMPVMHVMSHNNAISISRFLV